MELDMNKFNEMVDKFNEGPKRKVSGVAKKITYAIIIISFVVGIVGSFEDIPFNMDGYVSFIPVFASLFIPLVLSIGVNSAMDKKNKTELEKELLKYKEKNEKLKEQLNDG